MADPTLTLKVAGTTINLDNDDLVVGRCVVYAKGGVPSLAFYKRGGAIPPLPDAYLGKLVTLALDSGSGPVVRFAGMCTARNPEFVDSVGWVTAYQVLGLRHVLDLFPLTNENTGMDTAGYNLDPTDTSNYIAANAGRNVGQILTSILTAATNAGNLNTYGLGAYTSMGPPAVLPASTVADLAAMTVVPQTPIYAAGEKFGSAIEGLIDEVAPNYCLWIEPATGALRFLDMRAFASHTFTLDSDPIEPTPLSRDIGDCFQRVEVRGSPVVEPWLLSLQNGQLAEDFSAGDKTAFIAGLATWNGQGNQDSGNCTCPGTTSVTITTTATYTLDQLDQSGTGAHASITLLDSSLTGLTMMSTRRVIANTATSGGTATLTLDLPLPVTSYNKFQLFYNLPGTGAFQRYRAVNTHVGAALQNQFSYPTPYVAANGLDAALTSVPLGSVVYGSGPAYNEFPVPFTQDPTTGKFFFLKPTYIVATNSTPHDVRVFAAVATGANHAIVPADISGVPQFEGTSNTIDGRDDTLIVTVSAWKDPGILANMQAYARDLLDSVKDAVIEGSITYYGYFEAAVTMGLAATVTGNGFTTGWETCTSFGGHPGLPIVECELAFDMLGGPTNIQTIMHCSNRRAHYQTSQFLRPERTGFAIGTQDTEFGVTDAAAALGGASGYAGRSASSFGDASFGTKQGSVRSQDMPDDLTAGQAVGGLNSGMSLDDLHDFARGGDEPGTAGVEGGE